MKIDLSNPFTKIALKVVPVILAIIMLLLIRWGEYAFMPVVKDFHLTSVQRTESHVIMRGYMRKVRDCRFVGVSAEGVTDNGNVDLPLKFLESNHSDNSTRPQGTQDWGPWRIVIPVAPSVSAIDLRSVHSCHLAWETTTRLARVPLLPLLTDKGN